MKNNDITLTLLDNIQFIYELHLAQLEIKSFGIEYEITEDLREFKLKNITDIQKELIKKRSSYFKSINNQFTDYFCIIQKNRTRSVNRYLTHWFYPYKGKFHPQMIRSLINIIGLKEKDILLDPFLGSGTTALEAQLLGINFIGIDISPVCIVLAKGRTESIEVINEIENLKEKVIKLDFDKMSSEFYYKFINEMTNNEKVKNFYILARLMALSDYIRRKRKFLKSFINNLELMIASLKDYLSIKNELNLVLGEVKIEKGDARNLNLPDNSVDGIITSPPYSIALDYIENDKHSLIDLGYDLKEIRENLIGLRGKRKERIEIYNEDMKKAYSEMYRVLKPNKYAVIIIGNATYQKEEIKTIEFTIEFMENIGFSLEKNINKIIHGVYNVINKENILIFKKQN